MAFAKVTRLNEGIKFVLVATNTVSSYFLSLVLISSAAYSLQKPALSVEAQI